MLNTKLNLKEFTMPDGRRDEGQLLRYWRKEILHWHETQRLVDLYNEVMEDGHLPVVSIRWWQRMEQHNKVPVDKKRRWVIATILNLPSTYLALPALAPLFPRQESPRVVLRTSPALLDAAEYDRKLQHFWNSYYPREAGIEEIVTRINTLESTLLYGTDQQRKLAAPLLCNYLILFGNIRRSQGYSSALSYLHKAVVLAKEKGFYDLQARALYVRGYTYLDKWSFRPKTDQLSNALNDFGAAQEIIDTHKLHATPLEAAVSSEWGYALAHNVLDKEDRTKALGKVDRAGSIVSASGYRRDPYFLDINREWYHIDKADTFIALKSPQSASEELNNIIKGNPRTKRRYLTMDVVEAKAYAAKGQVEMAVAYAESVLDVAQEIQSYEHLTRIINIYDELRMNEKYCTCPDLVRLGIKLLKVRMPELFVD